MGIFNKKDNSIPISKGDITVSVPLKFETEPIYNIIKNAVRNHIKLTDSNGGESFTKDRKDKFKNVFSFILNHDKTKGYCKYLKNYYPDVINCDIELQLLFNVQIIFIYVFVLFLLRDLFNLGFSLVS